MDKFFVPGLIRQRLHPEEHPRNVRPLHEDIVNQDRADERGGGDDQVFPGVVKGLAEARVGAEQVTENEVGEVRAEVGPVVVEVLRAPVPMGPE